jgi:hypothetical protein
VPVDPQRGDRPSPTAVRASLDCHGDIDGEDLTQRPGQGIAVFVELSHLNLR